ncbi:hypothetical protein E3T26_06810 [Cryobacterium sp. TMT1-21]|uniref:hypothetical protein n=1 Tax=unclassified Cryobacterium TaxID=2649013 RepID=UPI0010696583|nr:MULTISPECIES: hypothetical protein [unclassified Cryobacterium]TFC84026.1 hypothetical protein E3T24_10985 [Cryobacterium sp. TmT2-59]TFD15486.1 hypothetical protein E3T26_06810 [Cryobacterium sp. TMT1-21]TFD18455.1 hypothetical protein E3T32_12190 [Cryobacterium sp. TMT2-23]
MRWDNLFDDLEGQLEHELNAEETDLRAEEERLRLGRLSLRNRLTGLARASGLGAGVLRVVLASGETLTLRPTTFGRDWLAADLLDAGSTGAQCVLPLAAVAGVIVRRDEIPDSLVTEPESAVRLVDRIGLPFVLRDLCRRRANIEVHTRSGPLRGTIDRVGRDHVDLAVHAAGTLRRESEVHQYRIVPITEIQLVRLP